MISLPIVTIDEVGPPLKTLNGRRPKKSEVSKSECLCDYCTAMCCRYFALPIDTPTEMKEFDYLRWYLLHDRATAFYDTDTWYLLVHTKCKHLQPNHMCGIYFTRPEICREYSTKNCEYDNDAVYDRYFETPEQVAEYIEARFCSEDTTKLRSPRPKALDKVGV